MNLKDFNSRYKYQSDKEKFNTSLDVWEIPKQSEDGFIYGDCESYCRYLKNNISEFKDWDYYYCKLNGVGHCVLYKNGDIIDCNFRAVLSIDAYCRIYDISDFKKYNWFTVFSKVLISSLFLSIIRIKGIK